MIYENSIMKNVKVSRDALFFDIFRSENKPKEFSG